MKTIGLIGGMSWESSQVYYRQLNQIINQHLGGLHSAEIIMINVDFAPIEQLMVAGQWSAIKDLLIQHCWRLQTAGAECLVIATNTMHRFADDIEAVIDIPLLHIADAVGLACQAHCLKQVGLLGTQFTMELDFYHSRLASNWNIQTLIPEQQQRDQVNQIIFDELCHGRFLPRSKNTYLAVMESLAAQGADAMVLGCTEIGLLVQQQDTGIKLIDATEEHIKLAVGFALS